MQFVHCNHSFMCQRYKSKCMNPQTAFRRRLGSVRGAICIVDVPNNNETAHSLAFCKLQMNSFELGTIMSKSPLQAVADQIEAVEHLSFL